MKKAILFTSFCLTAMFVSAQDLISKIPSNASAVVALKGKNFTELVTTTEFENSKLGNLFFKELTKKTDGKVTNLESLGVDIEQNFYYFLQNEEGSLTHTFLVPLKNKENIVALLPKRTQERVDADGNISYFTDLYDAAVTMWNNETLIMVIYQEANTYDDYGYDDFYGYDDYTITEEAADAVEATEDGMDDVIADVVEDAAEAVVVEEEIVVEKIEDDEEYIEETIIESTESEYDENGYYNDDYYNEDYYKKQEERRLEREAKQEERRKENLVTVVEKAKSILTGTYAQGNILSNRDYVSSIGSDKEEASFWLNDFGNLYMEAMPALFGGTSSNNPYKIFNFSRLYGGMSLTAKLNFEADKASVITLYKMNDEMASFNREMYNGKMNSNFYKYFNEDQMQGYFSINASTEGILKAYPKMIDAMFTGVEKDHLEDLVPIATRLVSLLLDEEAIAKMVRGDMLFVMNGIEQKEVTYTTYEYDENYESTEVTKTKMETIPNFLFMVTSEEKEIFDRLMRIGTNEGVVTFENGFYQVNIPDVPFSLSMLFKGNTLLIGNSAKDIMAISNGSFNAKVSSKHKKRIAKNSGSIYINGKNMTKSIPTDMVPEVYKEKVNYIATNVEDMEFKVGKIKGNVLQSEFILNTPKDQGHKNSLAYFIHMIDALID